MDCWAEGRECISLGFVGDIDFEELAADLGSCWGRSCLGGGWGLGEGGERVNSHYNNNYSSEHAVVPLGNYKLRILHQGL